jgi:hypothetical protein
MNSNFPVHGNGDDKDRAQFPVLLEAWKEALNSDPSDAGNAQLNRYLDANPEVQKEMLRELYMFLHAQQLVAMTSRLEDISKSQHVIQQRLASQKPKSKWWHIGWSGFLTIGLNSLAVVLGGISFLRTQGR